jgi:hypothetical protein
VLTLSVSVVNLSRGNNNTDKTDPTVRTMSSLTATNEPVHWLTSEEYQLVKAKEDMERNQVLLNAAMKKADEQAIAYYGRMLKAAEAIYKAATKEDLNSEPTGAAIAQSPVEPLAAGAVGGRTLGQTHAPYSTAQSGLPSPTIQEPGRVPPSPVAPVAEKLASLAHELNMPDPEPGHQKEVRDPVSKEQSAFVEAELEKEIEVGEPAGPVPAVPIVATQNQAHIVFVNGRPTIEHIILQVPLLAGLVRQPLRPGPPNPLGLPGFSRLIISKTLGGTPQGTWPKPMSGKAFPYMLKGCDSYICVQTEMNNWLPMFPGHAGALSMFWDEGGLKAAHGKVYPLFIRCGTNRWVYFSHYRTFRFPTTNGEVPVDRFRQFSATQKRKWCQHILQQPCGREHLASMGVITAAQAKLTYKELIQEFSPAALLPHFERPDNQNPLRLRLRLLVPVCYDQALEDLLIAQSKQDLPVVPPPIIPQRRPLDSPDDGQLAKRPADRRDSPGN